MFFNQAKELEEREKRFEELQEEERAAKERQAQIKEEVKITQYSIILLKGAVSWMAHLKKNSHFFKFAVRNPS